MTTATQFAARAAKVSTIGEAKRLVGSAAKQYRGSLSAVAVAAYATHTAVRTGYLGDGRRKDAPAGMVSTSVYAQMFGVNVATVTKWRTLGIALVTVGIEPESELFRILAHEGLATYGDVSAAIKADKSTVAKVQTAVAKVQADQERKRLASKTAGSANKGKSKGKGSETTQPKVTPIGDLSGERAVEAFEMLCARLGALSGQDKGLTQSQRNRVREIATDLVSVVGTHAAQQAQPKAKRTKRTA